MSLSLSAGLSSLLWVELLYLINGLVATGAGVVGIESMKNFDIHSGMYFYSCSLSVNTPFWGSQVFDGISFSPPFESWLMSVSLSAGLSSSSCVELLYLINGLVATWCRDRRYWIDEEFHSAFIMRATLLIITWFVIRSTWLESYGTGNRTVDHHLLQTSRMGKVLEYLLPRYAGKDFTCTGPYANALRGIHVSIRLPWVLSLQRMSRSKIFLGYIFSSLMISMILGPLLYTAITSFSQMTSVSYNNDKDSPLTLDVKRRSLVCIIRRTGPSIQRSVQRRTPFYFFIITNLGLWTPFCTFCLLEACAGMHHPVQGTLISNEHQVTVKYSTRFPNRNKSKLFVTFDNFPWPTRYLCRQCLPSGRYFVNAQIIMLVSQPSWVTVGRSEERHKYTNASCFLPWLLGSGIFLKRILF